MRFRMTLLAGLFPLLAATPSFAAEPLKVCAAADELPYSNKEGRGFENRLADLIAGELGRTVENVYWEDPRYFVRDFLDKGLCDVVMGVDSGDPRLATTRTYYRSGYVFVHRKGTQVESWDAPLLKTAKRIAFIPDTPAETMLRKIGRYNDLFNYMHSLVGFKSRRNAYVKWDPAKLVDEVASGNAEVAVLWGPAAARYVREHAKDLEMTVIPDGNLRGDGEKVPHHYATSIGVRKADKVLLNAIDQALAKREKDVSALLTEEGIPLLPIGAEALARK